MCRQMTRVLTFKNFINDWSFTAEELLKKTHLDWKRWKLRRRRGRLKTRKNAAATCNFWLILLFVAILHWVAMQKENGYRAVLVFILVFSLFTYFSLTYFYYISLNTPGTVDFCDMLLVKNRIPEKQVQWLN